MAKNVEIKITENKRLKKKIYGKQPSLVIGVLEPDANIQYLDKDVTIGQVSLWNHQGTQDAPARPFLSIYVDENRDKIIKQYSSAMARVTFAGENEREALGKLGKAYVRGIQTRIRKGVLPRNKQSTLRQKEGSTPLIDTGVLINSISWDVEK